MKNFKWHGLCFVLIVLALGCGGDNGVNPPANQVNIVSVSPVSLGLGAKGVNITIMGSGFTAAAVVDLGPGITVASTEVAGATEIDVTANVDAAAASGPRTVIVRVGAQQGQLAGGLNISDAPAPVAQFTVSPTQGTISTTFELDGSGSTVETGRITQYLWEFSDGSTLHGMRVKKQFAEKGEYTVRLTTTDDKKISSTAQRKFEVGDNLPPDATFTVTPTSGTNLTTFNFDASASLDPDGAIASYKWTFTDNGTASGLRFDRKFQNTGTITAQLEVKDNKGAVTIAKRNIDVKFFDGDAARKEISDVLIQFLTLFGNLEHLSAEEICVGFSKNCNGRSREISIIKAEQPTVRQTGVRIIGAPEVGGLTDQHASASITADFYGQRIDGSSYSGIATHHVTMVNESGSWKICDFSVTYGPNEVASPIPAP